MSSSFFQVRRFTVFLEAFKDDVDIVDFRRKMDSKDLIEFLGVRRSVTDACIT